MHRGPLIQRRVLDVLHQSAGRVDAVHIDERRVVVEGVAVDTVRWFPGREHEDRPGFG